MFNRKTRNFQPALLFREEDTGCGKSTVEDPAPDDMVEVQSACRSIDPTQRVKRWFIMLPA